MRAEQTDIFVVSDHGFSTIERSMDLRKLLNDAVSPRRREFGNEPKPERSCWPATVGSVSFYVIGHDENSSVVSLNSCSNRILPE